MCGVGGNETGVAETADLVRRACAASAQSTVSKTAGVWWRLRPDAYGEREYPSTPANATTMPAQLRAVTRLRNIVDEMPAWGQQPRRPSWPERQRRAGPCRGTSLPLCSLCSSCSLAWLGNRLEGMGTVSNVTSSGRGRSAYDEHAPHGVQDDVGDGGGALQDHEGEHVVPEVGQAAQGQRAERRGGGGRQEGGEVHLQREERHERHQGAAAHDPVKRRSRSPPPLEEPGT